MPIEIKLESVSADSAAEIMQVSHGTVTIGREPENHVVVDSEAVSRRHGCLLEAQNHWVFKDFESSNGTWLNGTKLIPGQIKLIRHGDVLRLADFSMRISELLPRPEAQLVAEPPSLLIFYKESFETEFPLATPSAAFQLGGPDGHFFIEGASAETVFLRVAYNGDRLELSSGDSQEQVLLNGSNMSGVSAISDRDEIVIPPYRIVVNDFGSALPAPPLSDVVSSSEPAKPAVQAYDKLHAPEHLQAADRQDDGWVSEAARRRSSTGQKFVFGSDEEDPMTSTMTLGAVNDRPSGTQGGLGNTGYEMSASQKFATVAYSDDQEKKGFGETFLVVMGVVVFILLIVFVVYLLVAISG